MHEPSQARPNRAARACPFSNSVFLGAYVLLGIYHPGNLRSTATQTPVEIPRMQQALARLFVPGSICLAGQLRQIGLI